jgi:hypothetical protein
MTVVPPHCDIDNACGVAFWLRTPAGTTDESLGWGWANSLHPDDVAAVASKWNAGECGS